MNKSIVYILLAGVFFSLVNILVKSLKEFHVFELIFFRSLFVLLASYIDIKRKKTKIFNEHWRLLTLRGLSGSLALCCYFYTLHALPLASAVTIQYLSPIFSVFIAAIFFGEHFNPKQLPFIALAFSGVVIIKEFDPNITGQAAIIGVCGAMLTGLAYTAVRMLKGKATTNLVIFYFPLITLPLVTPFVLDHWVTPNFEQGLKILALVVLTYVAQIFLTLGYQGDRIAKVAVFRYVGLIYAVFWGHYLFDEKPSPSVLIGILMILTGVILNNRFSFKN